MERGGAANGLPTGFRPPDPGPNGHLWWHYWLVDLHAKSRKDFSASHHLSAQRNRSFASPRLLYSGASGQVIKMCPSRPPCPAVSTLHIEPDITTLPLLIVQLITPHHSVATTGMGAVLSQYHREPPCLHPCAYYSRKLTPVEQNYDISNRELLAIKLALEEWRHWLEGAQHPFTVIMDQKNLEYLRSAKRLNSLQARWALFFTRFQFAFTYQPGDKNIKADSLSRIHSPDEPSSPEPILPPVVLVSPIQWALQEQIRVATLTEPAPLGGPEGKTYVPSSL